MLEPLVSVEYGHTVLDPTTRDPQLLESALESARIAKLAIDLLKTRGFGVQSCVLLDDKYLSPALDREHQAELFLARLPLSPDVAVFESDLRSLAPEMLKLVEEPRKSKLTRELENRAAKGFPLACSVDVTIWHLLRLGLIPARDQTGPTAAFNSSLASADYAISILPGFEKSYEERAYRDNLTSVTCFRSDRLRVFYFEDGEEALVQRGRIWDFIHTIGKD